MAMGPFSSRDHVEITTLGTEFALSEILGAWLGYLADARWGTSPWCLIAGVITGFALGFYIILRAAGRMQRSHITKKAKKQDGRS